MGKLIRSSEITKGVFTSCKKEMIVHPGNLVQKIKHDKKKREISYDDALKVYDVPIAYFPKFFHQIHL